MYQVWLKSLAIYSSYRLETKIKACLRHVTRLKYAKIFPLANPNQNATISMHIPSLVKIHWCLLKLSSRNQIWTDGRMTDGQTHRYPTWNHNTLPLLYGGYKKNTNRQDKWFWIIHVNQNKIVSFKIKRLGKNDIPSDVERTVEHCQNNLTHIIFWTASHWCCWTRRQDIVVIFPGPVEYRS